MINHSVNLNLFDMRVQEFKDAKHSLATKQCNDFLHQHNDLGQGEHAIEPVDIKYVPTVKGTSILLQYVPIDHSKVED